MALRAVDEDVHEVRIGGVEMATPARFAELAKRAVDLADFERREPRQGFAHDAIQQLIAHRLKREAKVMAAVRSTGGGTMDELVKVVYDDVDKIMHPVAKRSLYAHLDKLAQDGMITGSAEGRWQATA